MAAKPKSSRALEKLKREAEEFSYAQERRATRQRVEVGEEKSRRVAQILHEEERANRRRFERQRKLALSPVERLLEHQIYASDHIHNSYVKDHLDCVNTMTRSQKIIASEELEDSTRLAESQFEEASCVLSCDKD